MSYPKKIDRGTVLESALAFIEAHGLDQLSMRALASELGVTPNALYRYFASKAELEYAMADEAGKILLLEFAQGMGNKSAQDALRVAAHIYLAFARRRPALYALKMRFCKDGDSEPESHKQLWAAMLMLVDGLQGPWQAEDLAISFWAYLHGLVNLDQAGLLGGIQPEEAVEVGLDVFLTGLMAAAQKTLGA